MNVKISTEGAVIEGELTLPLNPIGIIIFSHGSGSSRFSPRNKMVADMLHANNFGTLLIDLLTKQEDTVYGNRFNIDLLSERLISVTEWVRTNPSTKHIDIGYFGASTGAASALQAAARPNNPIKALVSRGGRPDLALKYLPDVKAPTLLIVGENDPAVIEFNQEAYKKLNTKKEIQIIPGATHLFEEPGKLEQVAQLAAKWYQECFVTRNTYQTYI